ncbi:hypothetical protein Tco_0281502 [Tanacetum coccineum]
MSKKELLRLDEELAFKLQAKEAEEERLAREKVQQLEEWKPKSFEEQVLCPNSKNLRQRKRSSNKKLEARKATIEQFKEVEKSCNKKALKSKS